MRAIQALSARRVIERSQCSSDDSSFMRLDTLAGSLSGVVDLIVVQ